MFLIWNLARIRSASPESATISSRIASSSAASSGSSAAKRSSAPAAAVSTTVPEGRTSTIDSTVEYESRVVPQRIPPELFAITPPTVAMSVLAGSGPSLRPWGASTRLACPRIVPGLTRTRSPSSSASTPLKWRRTSTRIPPPWPCPLRLVPPPRRVTGTPSRRP